jgi:hypothetical protein
MYLLDYFEVKHQCEVFKVQLIILTNVIRCVLHFQTAHLSAVEINFV